MLKLKGNKGITLIALIITIIVLLILAGVTISAINGNENTMGKAKIAKEENEIANELEAIKLAITDAMAKGLNGKVSDVHLRESIAGIIDDSELNNISGEGPWTIKTKLGKTYEINGYGQIQETVVLEPTDIYVALDGNTLRFYSSIDNVPQNLVSSLYTDSNGPRDFKDVNFTDYSQIPWNNVKTSITRASIEDVIVPTSTARWFNECAITGVDHIENLKTNCVTDMNRMFRNCSNLESIDVSKFDTSNVTDMSTMFQLCSKLTTLDVSNFKTGKVENMQWMFNECSGLTELDVSKWDTSNVTNMSAMFRNCSKLTELDVSNWDTSNVTNMASMFWNCSSLTELDVSNFKTGKVEDMSYMFGGGPGIVMNFSNLGVSNWDTSNVTNMSTMFQNCSKLTELDLSNWDTSKVTDMRWLLGGDSEPKAITTIYVGDKWNTDAVTQSDYMFWACPNLLGGKETRFDSNYRDKSRAKVDGGISDPGYFTHINDKGYDYTLAWGTPQNVTLYGNDVSYTSFNGTSSWKLFYQNENNTYLISTDLTNGTYNPYYYDSNYTAESFNDEKNVAKKLNPKLALKKGELFTADTLNHNMKALAWFCDTDYWKGYTSGNTTASTDGSTSYAVFSPSLELLTISFNSDKNDTNFTAELPEPITGIKGYNLLYSNTTLPTNYNNGIYSSDGNNTYWMSSPYNEIQYGHDSFFVRRDGKISASNVINNVFYGRPIVCIPNSSFDNKTISGYVE